MDDVEDDWIAEEGGEATDDDDGDAPEELRDGVLERIWLAVVGDCRVDLPTALGIDESLGRGDDIVLDLEVWFTIEEEDEGGTVWLGIDFDIVWPFVERWDTTDDDDEEFALIVDVGLIERLRDANVDPRYCCTPGTAGRGIKPKRVCMVIGGGGRFVIDIGRLTPLKISKIKINFYYQKVRLWRKN